MAKPINPLSHGRKMKAEAFLRGSPQTQPNKVGENQYKVASKSKQNKIYNVTLGDTPTCDCPDFTKRFKGKGGVQCKHIHEVLLLEGLETK